MKGLRYKSEIMTESTPKNPPDIDLRYTRVMHKTNKQFSWNYHEIYPKYATDMLEICLSYVWNITNIYARDMP